MRRATHQFRAIGRQSLIRHLVVVAAWVCLVCQFSAYGHFLLVDHERCAEHGELIHGHGDHHGEHESISQADARSQRKGPAVRSFSVPEGHEHDHCLVSSAQKEVALTSTPTLERPSPNHPTQGVLAPVTRTIKCGSVYAFAPKTSPPV